MDSKELQLLRFKTADRNTWKSEPEKWYVVELKWMISWLQYMFHSDDAALLYPEPGPVANHSLLEPDELSVKPTLCLKTDYRVVCQEVWKLFVEYYGSCHAIAVLKEEDVQTTTNWIVQYVLPQYPDVPPPSSSETFTIELVKHVHTVKCNRRVSVCNTPGKFREREIVRVNGKEPGGDRIVWWRRRRRLGEDHSHNHTRDDESDLNAWERIPNCSGSTQYIIRMEEHDHLIRT